MYPVSVQVTAPALTFIKEQLLLLLPLHELTEKGTTREESRLWG